MDDRIGHFLHFLSAEKGASENTIAAYRNDLSQFDIYLQNGHGPSQNGNGHAIEWQGVGKDTIVDYVIELKNRRYAGASVARKVAAVKSFFQFLHAEGEIKTNPTESL
ncbi:MAG: site-specific integrase, partial [Chloroflexi bacterium]|nr:site-specific integrase [Chloroflexota bacterium]